MNLPALIPANRIDEALRHAIEHPSRPGVWLVPAYDVPDHFTAAGEASYGMVKLNRVGLAWRTELLARQA